MKERGYRRGLAAFLIPLGALVGVGALLLLFWGTTSLWSFFHTDSQVYRENWGLALPQEVEQEYSALSPDRAMGDGWRYTVFQAGEAAPYFEDLCQERDFPEEELRDWAARSEAAEEWLPDFDGCRGWSQSQEDGSTLWVLYDPWGGESLFFLHDHVRQGTEQHPPVLAGGCCLCIMGRTFGHLAWRPGGSTRGRLLSAGRRRRPGSSPAARSPAEQEHGEGPEGEGEQQGQEAQQGDGLVDQLGPAHVVRHLQRGEVPEGEAGRVIGGQAIFPPCAPPGPG